jgi:hypothetical protein
LNLPLRLAHHSTSGVPVGAGPIMTPYQRSKADPLSRGPTTFSGLDTSLAGPTSADRERELDQGGRVGRDQKAAPGEAMGVKAIARRLGVARNTVRVMHPNYRRLSSRTRRPRAGRT